MNKTFYKTLLIASVLAVSGCAQLQAFQEKASDSIDNAQATVGESIERNVDRQRKRDEFISHLKDVDQKALIEQIRKHEQRIKEWNEFMKSLNDKDKPKPVVE